MRNFWNTLKAAPRIMLANARANPALAAVALTIDLVFAAIVVGIILWACGGCG